MTLSVGGGAFLTVLVWSCRLCGLRFTALNARPNGSLETPHRVGRRRPALTRQVTEMARPSIDRFQTTAAAVRPASPQPTACPTGGHPRLSAQTKIMASNLSTTSPASPAAASAKAPPGDFSWAPHARGDRRRGDVADGRHGQHHGDRGEPAPKRRLRSVGSGGDDARDAAHHVLSFRPAGERA